MSDLQIEYKPGRYFVVTGTHSLTTGKSGMEKSPDLDIVDISMLTSKEGK